MNVQPIRISDLQKVDPLKACEYFNNCFRDPSTFNVVIVGNIDPSVALPLILQYLVSRDSFSPHCLGETIYFVLPGLVIFHAGWDTKAS